MSPSSLLIDNDAFIVLAGVEVLEPIAGLLGFPFPNVKRLPTLPFVMGRSKPVQKHYDKDVLQKAQIACGQIPAITSRPGDDVFQRLTEVPGIDAGEALLFGLLFEDPSFCLLTGDKKSLRALAAAPGLSDIKTRLRGRVICLETAVKRHADSAGVPVSAQKFAPVVRSLKSFQVVFSSANVAEPRLCFEALDQYLQDLVRDVGDGFLRL